MKWASPPSPHRVRAGENDARGTACHLALSRLWAGGCRVGPQRLPHPRGVQKGSEGQARAAGAAEELSVYTQPAQAAQLQAGAGLPGRPIGLRRRAPTARGLSTTVQPAPRGRRLAGSSPRVTDSQAGIGGSGRAGAARPERRAASRGSCGGPPELTARRGSGAQPRPGAGGRGPGTRAPP